MVDQIELIVEVAKGGTRIRSRSVRVGYFDLTFSVTLVTGYPGTRGGREGMRVGRSLASPGLLKFLANPTVGPLIAKAFSAEIKIT